MKIQIRQRDASMPQEDGWPEMGDWLADISGDDDARPPGDGHVESDGSDDPRPEAPAQTDARAQADARAEAPEEAAVTPPTATQRNRPRPLEVAQCSLCGIALPLGLLVPDGGQACADIHWYCKDAMSCTKRWTAAHPPGLAHIPTAADTPTMRNDV
jgi:hypothetical protein